MRTYFLALLTLLLAAPAYAGGPTVKVSDYHFDGIGYTVEGDSKGKVSLYATPAQVGDKLAICGIVILENAKNITRVYEKRFSEKIEFKLSGRRLTVSTDLFKRYTSNDAAKAGVAGCSVTDIAWDPAFAKTKLELTGLAGKLRE